jgi:hypothetical protein
MAQELAHIHQRHRGRIEDQRVRVPEQHGDPEAAERGGLRLLVGPADADEGEAPERDDVQRIPASVPAVQLHHDELAECDADQRDAGDSAALPQLDPARLHLRDGAHPLIRTSPTRSSSCPCSATSRSSASPRSSPSTWPPTTTSSSRSSAWPW